MLVNAPLSHVWHFIKLQDFSKFWSALKSSEHVKGASEETDIVKWTFKDGHVLEVKQEEHSVCFHSQPTVGTGTFTDTRSQSTTTSLTPSSPPSLR